MSIRHFISQLVPDKYYLQYLYKKRTGKVLNLKNPKTFNEKLQWLKLYDRNPLYTIMVDKYEVKKYISESIGDQYVIPNYGVWSCFEDIEFDKLPNQFVLKCTHDSGGIIICTDKTRFDIKKAKLILDNSIKTNYYKLGREWPYKNVKPRIIAELYLEDKSTNDLRDYKFFAFNGSVKAMFIATERQNEDKPTAFDFYDREFKHLDIRHGHPNAEIPPKKPVNYEKMCELSEKLSIGIPHVRVDFYEVNGKIYFGEMTFSHHGGLLPFDPEKWDEVFGNWIELPKRACK